MVTGYSRVKCGPRLTNVYIWWSQMVDRCGPGRDSAYIVNTGPERSGSRASRWERSGVHRSTNTITSPPILGRTQKITEKQLLFKLKFTWLEISLYLWVNILLNSTFYWSQTFIFHSHNPRSWNEIHCHYIFRVTLWRRSTVTVSKPNTALLCARHWPGLR